MVGMAVIRRGDLEAGRHALSQWREAAETLVSHRTEQRSRASARDGVRHGSGDIEPDLPRQVWAMAVRYALHLLELRAPGPAVEVRVAPWGAVKILQGPDSDPHNLTPPDVVELDPPVWLRVACGITTWDDEVDAGHIREFDQRDNLSRLLPLV